MKSWEAIVKNEYSHLNTLSGKEVQELACCWCYYSGKIEGNTYTYVETESLLLDNITSPKRYDDAKMLKNLYNTFISELEYICKHGNKEEINEQTMLRLHSMLISELVDGSEKGKYRDRPVRITGTDYIPPKTKLEIIQAVNECLQRAQQIENPIEKAVFVHCNIARIQPFIDGNKRTSRMLEAIIYMNNNLIPPFSTKDADILEYRKALIDFYEKEDYSAYIRFSIDRMNDRMNIFQNI
ncbi:MAG: Fic family protein [Paludibacteraceae bacterium]|nr:Fic family protein [Paludibacteraceae bacterium]